MPDHRSYYNDIDPEAVAVLRELIACGVIAPGDVDSRSIKDVTENDIRGYTQCHFFAGAGLWSVAAGIAGWPNERPLWTASCPCQPISAAGRQLGANDPRHLWPDLFRLIRAARAAGQPIPILVGEQVAGALGYDWFDGVRTDLAREEIAARTIDIPACAVDAPHERNRLWWCAVAHSKEQHGGAGLRENQAIRHGVVPTNRDSCDLVLANSDIDRQQQPSRYLRKERRWRVHRHAPSVLADAESFSSGGEQPQRRAERRTSDGVADAIRCKCGYPETPCDKRKHDFMHTCVEANLALGDTLGEGLEGQRRDGDDRVGWEDTHRPIATADGRNGSFWSDAEWVTCHDGKARRAKPGIPMLVDGMAGRIAVWRLAGNSIVPQLAAEVLAAILEAEACLT